MNFSAALEKQHGVSFVAAPMVSTVKNMVSSGFQSGNSPQKNQRYNLLAKFRSQYSNIPNIIKDVDGEETGSLTFCISGHNDGNFFLFWTGKGLLLVRAESQYVRNSMKHYLFNAPFLSKSKGVFSTSCMACTRDGTQGRALSLLHTSAQPLPQTRVQPRALNKCSPIPCASISTTPATSRRSEKRAT